MVFRISKVGGYDSSQWGTANVVARAKERREVGSSFVTGSSQHENAQQEGGGRLPRGRVLGAPIPISDPLPRATSH